MHDFERELALDETHLFGTQPLPRCEGHSQGFAAVVKVIVVVTVGWVGVEKTEVEGKLVTVAVAVAVLTALAVGLAVGLTM